MADGDGRCAPDTVTHQASDLGRYLFDRPVDVVERGGPAACSAHPPVLRCRSRESPGGEGFAHRPEVRTVEGRPPETAVQHQDRSEERRVGKEWRARTGTAQYKKAGKQSDISTLY